MHRLQKNVSIFNDLAGAVHPPQYRHGGRAVRLIASAAARVQAPLLLGSLLLAPGPAWGQEKSGNFLFTTDTYTVTERESSAPLDTSVGLSTRGALITVTRTNGPTGRVLVDFAATGGADMVPTNGTLAFDDYQMSAKFVVQIKNVPGPGPDQDVSLVLSNARLDTNETATIIAPTISVANATIKVLDLDGDKTGLDSDFVFNFEKKVWRTTEEGNARITVICTGTNTAATSIDVSTRLLNTFPLQAGSDYATPAPFVPPPPGYDFIPTNFTVMFPQGASPRRQTFEIPILPDDLVEFNEDFQLFISGGGNADTATVTILSTNATAGSVDVSFNPDNDLTTDPPNNANPGANGVVYSLLLQTNNSLLIAGDFTAYNGIPTYGGGNFVNHIARLNPDGSLDTTFQPGSGADGFITSMKAAPDGSIYIGGGFTAFNGQQRYSIARLDTNGVLDTTFNPGLGVNGTVWAIDIPNASQILIAGDFTSVNGAPRNYIARLNSDGSVDPSFDPGTSINAPIYALGLRRGALKIDRTASGDDQEDRLVVNTGANSGVITINWNFYSVPDEMRVYYDGVRIYDSGYTNGAMTVMVPYGPGASTDVTIVMNEGGGTPGTVWDYTATIDSTSGDQIFIGGDFTDIGGVTRNRIGRLLGNGTLDTTFDTGAGANDTVYALAAQADGKLIVGGAFSAMDLRDRNGIARLNTDGSLDTSFENGTGADNTVYSLTVQPDGGILAGGLFATINSTRRVGIARLLPQGPVDTSFLDPAYNQFAGVTRNTFSEPRNFVFATALDSSANVLIGGGFARVGGVPGRDGTHPRRNVARLLGGSTLGPGNIEFPFSDYSGSEGASLFITLTRTNGNLGPASATFSPVQLPLGPGAAVSNVDFTFNPTNFGSPTWIRRTGAVQLSDAFFGPNNLTASTRDDVYVQLLTTPPGDGARSLNLQLSQPKGFDVLFLGGENIALGVALGKPNATLTIVDEATKPGILSFSSPTFTVDEGGVAANITVSRTDGSDGLVTVQYATVPGGTATEQTDYKPRSGTLTFPSTVTNRSFSIFITDDSEVEPDETVNLRLFNPTGGASNGLSTAQLTIIDNDFAPGRLNFSATNYNVAENAGPAVVTVTRTGGSVGSLIVQVATSNGTAGGSDYLGITTNLTWNSGDTSAKTFTVPIVDDGSVEGNETINVVLSNPSVDGALGTRTNTTITIVDDDFRGAVHFSSAQFNFNENGGPAVVGVVRTDGSAESITVNFATSDATATNGLDYLGTNGTLSFGPGEVSKTFTVPILNNTVSNLPRALTLTLAGANPVGTLGAPSTASLRIIDDESFNESPGSLDTSYDSLAGMNGAVQTIALQPDGSLVLGGDFSQANGLNRGHVARLNPNGSLDTQFLASGAGANGSVRAIASQTDGRVLLGGVFTAVNGVPRYSIARLNFNGALDTLFDPGSGADGPVYSIAEGFNGTNRVVLVGGAFTGVNGAPRSRIARLRNTGGVDSAFDPGTGANGAVYAIEVYPTNGLFSGKCLIGGDFTFVNGAACGHIARLNADGSVDQTFTPGLGANDSIRAIRLQADGRILIGGLFTNVAGASLSHIARLNANGSRDTSFDPGVGADGAVYAIALQPDTRILIGGEFTRCNGVIRNHITRLNQDGSVDPTINFGFGANNYVAALAVQTNDLIVLAGGFTTYDNTARPYLARVYGRSVAGPGTFDFASAIYGADEAASNAVVTLRRRGGSSSPANGPVGGGVTVTIATSNGTATNGVNYLGGLFTAVFPPGETFKDITIPLLHDFVITPDLTVNLEVQDIQPLGLTNGLGSQHPATLVISNADSGVSFSSSSYSRSENAIDGRATIPILRYGSIRGTNYVTFLTTTNGTAPPILRYTPVLTNVIFNPGQTVQNVYVPITNNPVVDGNATVTMTLQNPTNTLLLNPKDATLTILDDESSPGIFTFSATNYIVGEKAPTAVLTVLRTNGGNGIVTVDYSTQDGTAFAGIKYTPTNGTLIFTEGETVKTITVRILDESQVEGNVSFLVNLTNPQNGATIATNSTATIVTILDDDSGISFASPAYVTSETNSQLTLTVVRSFGTNAVTRVDFATTNGTAVAGVNYTNLSGTLTFSPGETLKTINLSIKHDPSVTGNLSFGVNLFNATNLTSQSSAQVTFPGTASVILLDGETGISFTNSSLSVLENSNNAVITIQCSNPNVGAVSVNVITSDVTAQAGLDYVAVSNTLTFANGVTTTNILVPILDNLSVDGNRTFSVDLFNPSPANIAQLVSPSTLTVTILDNDAGLSFSSPAYSILKSGVAATIGVVRSGFTSNTVSVNYGTQDSSATNGVDYFASGGTLTFTNGETSKAFSVQVIDSTTVKPDRTLFLLLSNVVGNASLVAPSNATLTIQDNTGSLIVPAGVALLSEANAGSPNGVIDPTENVTLLFAFRNIAGASTTNLVATLLTNANVANVSASSAYGVLTPGGPSASRPFSFAASGTNGQQITARFWLQDGSANRGTNDFTFTLGSSSTVFSNNAAIVINDNANASPYPSLLTVSGMSGLVSKMTLNLNKLSHAAPADIDALVVSPVGQKVLFLANAGGNNAVNNLFLTFDDAASGFLPLSSQIVSGTNKPTPYMPVTSFPAPAPPPPYATNLSAFNGLNPNGTWFLYVLDDTPLDSGSISNGWSLSFTTANAVIGSADLAVGLNNAPNPVVLGSNLTYTISITNFGPAAATNLTLTDFWPTNASFLSASPAGYVTNNNFISFTNLGALPKDGVINLTLTLRCNTLGVVTNTAIASATSLDPNLVNNARVASVTVVNPQADLALTMVDYPNPVLLGNLLTYTNTVFNLGPATATAVKLTNTLPAGVQFVSASPVAYTVNGNVVTFTNLGNLLNGAQAVATIIVRPSLPGTITNNASVGSTAADPLKANNSASVKTVIQALQIALTRSGNNLTLSWPTNGASAFVLESAPSLNPPVAWTPQTNPPPQLVGSQHSFLVGTTNASRFFRLRAPAP